MSWYVHSGIVGVVEIREEAFNFLVAVALDLAGNSYCETLKAVIREFQIGKADERVDALLTFAKVVSFTDDEEQAKQLFAELLG